MIRAYSFNIVSGDPLARAVTSLPHPSIPASRHPWSFLILIEIDSREKSADAILQGMISEFTARHEASRATTGEEALTEVCRTFNEQMNGGARKNQQWYKNLHMGLVVIDGTLITLALYGNIRAYLLHHHAFVDIPKTVSPEPAHTMRGPFKVFTSLVEGAMAVGDTLMLSCAHLFDYFSVERLHAIMKEKSASDAATHLARMLKGLPGNVSVAAIIAESARAPLTTGMATRSVKDPNQSMVELNEREARTNQFLTPSLTRKIKGLTRSLRPAREPHPPLPVVEATEVSHMMNVRSRLHAGTLRTMQFLSMRVRALRNAALPRRPMPDAATGIITEASPIAPPPPWRAALHHLFTRFRRLPRSSQYLLIGAILLALLFIESLATIAHQRIRTREREAFAEGAARSEQMLNESEAALIYGDEEKARRAWKEASAALSTLQQRGNEEEKHFARLYTRAQDIREAIFHIRTIEKPDALLDLSTLNKLQTHVSPAGLAGPSGGYVLAFTRDTKNIFLVEPPTRTVTITSPDDSVTSFSLLRAIGGEQGVFYLVTETGLSRFDANAQTYAVLNTLPATHDIADIAYFSRRLYTLNRANGAIERHDLAGEGVKSPISWYADPDTLAGATSLTVDGSIYVADARGNIRKFTKGAEEQYSIGAIDPELRTPSRLAVDGNFLYVLEPTERRIVMLNKDGSLKEQITSPAFDRLTDMAVDSSRRMLYVLNGTVVYSVPFPE